MTIRKIVVHLETVQADAFGEACAPITRVAALAVIANPLAGRFERDLARLFDLGREVGEQLVAQARPLLQRPVVSYGKAAIVGVGGDAEHGGAMIHPKLGAPMRAAIGGGRSVIPSNVKIGSPGTAIDIPLGHKDDPWSFDHFDTLTVALADAPRSEEIVLCIAYADGGRPHARCGSGPITA